MLTLYVIWTEEKYPQLRKVEFSFAEEPEISDLELTELQHALYRLFDDSRIQKFLKEAQKKKHR